MTRMTKPDCAVMCSFINTHTDTHTHARAKDVFSGDFLLLYSGHFHSARDIILQPESKACRHRGASFAR